MQKIWMVLGAFGTAIYVATECVSTLSAFYMIRRGLRKLSKAWHRQVFAEYCRHFVFVEYHKRAGSASAPVLFVLDHEDLCQTLYEKTAVRLNLESSVETYAHAGHAIPYKSATSTQLETHELF
jgi:hypothetical protein